MSAEEPTQEFTYQEVSEHEAKDDVYVVIHDKVYDVSKFVDEHPYVEAPNPLSILEAKLGWSWFLHFGGLRLT